MDPKKNFRTPEFDHNMQGTMFLSPFSPVNKRGKVEYTLGRTDVHMIVSLFEQDQYRSEMQMNPDRQDS